MARPIGQSLACQQCTSGTQPSQTVWLQLQASVQMLGSVHAVLMARVGKTPSPERDRTIGTGTPVLYNLQVATRVHCSTFTRTWSTHHSVEGHWEVTSAAAAAAGCCTSGAGRVGKCATAARPQRRDQWTWPQLDEARGSAVVSSAKCWTKHSHAPWRGFTGVLCGIVHEQDPQQGASGLCDTSRDLPKPAARQSADPQRQMGSQSLRPRPHRSQHVLLSIASPRSIKPGGRFIAHFICSCEVPPCGRFSAGRGCGYAMTARCARRKTRSMDQNDRKLSLKRWPE
jgi:hypothetical protein